MMRWFGFVIILALFGEPQHSETLLTKEQVRDDMTYLLEAMEQAHPNLYHTTTRDALHEAAATTLERMPDNVNQTTAFQALATVTALVGEGHTGTVIPDSVKAAYKSERVFPVACHDVSDRGLVVEDTRYQKQGINPGDTITAINGTPATDLFARAMALQGGLRHFRHSLTFRAWPLWLFVMGVHAPFEVDVWRDDKAHRITLAGVPREEAAFSATNSQASAADYTFERLPDNIAYINFRSMSDLEAFEGFLDKTFRDIAANRPRGLIVDLRENTGGNSVLGKALLAYVNEKPYRMAGGTIWKVSVPYTQSLQRQEERMRKIFGEAYDWHMTEKPGTIMEIEASKPSVPDAEPLRFDGPVCFLIGPVTFSSANMLANTIEDYDLATLIGEPTGAASNEFGELCIIELPETGIKAYTSTKMFIRANGDKDDMRPVQPNIRVSQTDADTASGIDTVLERARRFIESGR